MAAIKALMPSQREKKRYLAFEAIAEKEFANSIMKLVVREITKFLGELGMAKAGIMIIPTQKNNQGILRIDHKHVNEVKAALTLIKEIDNQQVIVRSLGVSGILNKAQVYTR
ncbi:ribonuclease P protein component 2 [Candidatus Woesearchaeota archaeon]|nr:ribonuclease P protein component 2 [Candidatus Woesearchaeota archaeon]